LTSYETTRLEEYHERHHNTMFHRTNALHMRNYPSDPPEYTYEPFRDTATQSICDKGGRVSAYRRNRTKNRNRTELVC
jgi:hypothetical protein